jgi:hypothetical protein
MISMIRMIKSYFINRFRFCRCNNNEYKIKAMINDDSINYSFIDINIVHKMCELLEISSLKLNKSREEKKNDERKNKDITHVIHSFMTIRNHTKSFTLIMIIKLNQHFIILEKSWMKKHDVNYHKHDDSILFYFDHYNHSRHLNIHSQMNQQRKEFFSRKETSLINQKWRLNKQEQRNKDLFRKD